MKNLTALAIILLLLSGCTETIDGGGDNLDGYWYMSDMMYKAFSEEEQYQSPYFTYTEADSPRYMMVTGTHFVPYVDHGQLAFGYARLPFTAAKLISFTDADEPRDDSVVRYTYEDGVITVYGTAIVDFIRDQYGVIYDYNADCIITKEDAAVVSGIKCHEIDYSMIVEIPLNNIPYTINSCVVFSRTDQAHFESWCDK